jgi:hypothetical protein
MPKFMTYQRPVAVNRQGWSGKPGAPRGKPAPRPAPAQQKPLLDIRLPGLAQPRTR